MAAHGIVGVRERRLSDVATVVLRSVAVSVHQPSPEHQPSTDEEAYSIPGPDQDHQAAQ